MSWVSSPDGFLRYWRLFRSNHSFGQLPSWDSFPNGLCIHVIDRLSWLLFSIWVFAAGDQTFWERIWVDVMLIVELWHREARYSFWWLSLLYLAQFLPVIQLVLFKSHLISDELVFDLCTICHVLPFLGQVRSSNDHLMVLHHTWEGATSHHIHWEWSQIWFREFWVEGWFWTDSFRNSDPLFFRYIIGWTKCASFDNVYTSWC